MSEKCEKCDNPHDDWPGDEGLLCQDCWESECDKEWWEAVTPLIPLMQPIEDTPHE